MSNTFYIDANVRNSINVNETNNRFTYKLPQTTTLPTGTEVALQSSLINLQGITGGSIEIGEDITNTICFQYYAIDTNYPVATTNAMFATDQNLAYNLSIETTTRKNEDKDFTGNTFQPVSNLHENDSGYSEIIMPLAGEVEYTDGAKTLAPLVGKAKIVIKAGVYGINQLADLITDQINLKKLPDELSQDFYDYQQRNQQFNGMVNNKQTLRNFVVETASRWDEVAAGSGTALNQLTRMSDTQIGALDFKDIRIGADNREGLCSVIAITGNTNQDLRANAQAGGFGAGNITAGCSFADLCVSSQPTARYFIGWEKRNQYNNDPATASGRAVGFSPSTFNPFTNGMSFGTSGFNITYDENESAYTMNYLHEPNRIPTTDRFGTTLANSGQECVYIKSPVKNADSCSANVLASINNIMEKRSGILVYNWSLETARAEGDNIKNFGYKNNAFTEEEKEKCDTYRGFGAFFTTEAHAKQAWKKTIWFRMGFQYDDIQNVLTYGAGSTTPIQYGIVQNVEGHTTKQEIDIVVAPTISTIFNPTNQALLKIGTNNADPTKPKDKNHIRGALPAISDLQNFNLMGQNIPEFKYNNNTALGSFCVAPYKGSFYVGAVMLPVLTKGKPSAATKLPTLSENGYLLITSNIVEGNDILKNQQTDGLLDLIPKSSLSNQDYMADRNIISHTLSNPKNINEINIKILNPDMTDVALEDNSSVLLRITTPIPKPTNFIAEESLAAKSSQVGAVVQNLVASHTDPAQAQANARIDISNIQGEANSGDTGIDDDELAQATQALVLQAMDDELQGIQPPIPQGGMNPDAEDAAALQAEGRAEEVGVALAIARIQENTPAVGADQQQAEQHQVSPHSGVAYSGTEDYTRGIIQGQNPDLLEGRYVRNEPIGALRDEGLEEDEQEPVSRGAGPGRDRPKRSFKLKTPEKDVRAGRFGEEPRPSPQGGVMREGEVRSLKKLSLNQKQAAEARLEQLETARARAQGREKALGRSPRQQVEIRANIQELNRKIKEQEGLLKGFGGTPDRPAQRERRVEEIAANQKRRKLAARRSPARSGRGASEPDPEPPARRIPPTEAEV